MHILGSLAARAVVLFSFGVAAGFAYSTVSFSLSHRAHAALGSDIVCLVFTELNGVGSPIPPFEGGSCPPGSTPPIPEDTAALCSDSIDNDGDGFIDLSDPDCSAFVPPPPQDVCPNVGGVQETIPDGYELAEDGSCVAATPPPADACPNLDGLQESVPEGYELDNDGKCIESPTEDTGGGEGAGGGEDESSSEDGGSTDTGGGEGGGSPSTGPGPSGGGGGGVIGGPLSVGYQNNSTTTPIAPAVLGTSTRAAAVKQSDAPACGPYLNSYLRVGSRGGEVQKLQIFLNDHMEAGLPPTGYFGPLTERAVRAFQLRWASEILLPWVPYGLPSAQTTTGYVYKTTMRMINNLMCAGLALPIPSLP